MPLDVILLDLDGVVVQPGGYRAALKATVKYFLDQVGLGYLTPEDYVAVLLESIGITSEWDMAPICLAIALDAACAYVPETIQPFDWEQVSRFMISKPHDDIIQIDYPGKIQLIADFLEDGTHPVIALLNASSDGRAQLVFPYLSKTPLLEALFGDTRQVLKSMTTQVFQNYVLGDKVFSKTYGLSNYFQTDSYLNMYDQPLLSIENCGTLKKLILNGDTYLSVYTARPSLPPQGTSYHPSSYTPEAEMALEMVGLQEVPIIAYGRMKYLAEEMEWDVEKLLKPAPTQAMAAIFAALMGREWDALSLAGKIVQAAGQGNIEDGRGLINDSSPAFPVELNLHVFEDSAGGMRAVREASIIFNNIGIHTNTSYWGIARDEKKIAPLLNLGAAVFDDVNQALEAFIIKRIYSVPPVAEE